MDPELQLQRPCAFSLLRRGMSTLDPKTLSCRGLFALLSHPQLHTVSFSYIDPMFVVKVLRLVSSAIGRVGEDWLVEESVECAHPDGHVVLSAEGVQQLQQVFWAFNIFNAEAFVAHCLVQPKLEFVGCALHADSLESMNTLSHALLLRGLQSHNPGVRSRSLNAIQLVLEQSDQPSLYGVFGRDAFPLLAHIASKDVAYPQLRVKATGVLAHAGSGMQLHTHALIAAGAIQVLALGTSSPHQPADAPATVEAALWFLANIGGYGTFKAMLDLVREVGVIDAFHAGLRSSDVNAVRFVGTYSGCGV